MKQPEALRLAKWLEENDASMEAQNDAAAELRRLHEVNRELLVFANSYLEWIRPLIKDIGMQEMECKARTAIAKAKEQE